MCRKALIVAFLFMSILGSSSMAQQVPPQPIPGMAPRVAPQPYPKVAPQPRPRVAFEPVAKVPPQPSKGVAPWPTADPGFESCGRIASIFFRVSLERRKALAVQLRNCIELALR